jgi:S-adenosyl methyltransferase
VSGEGGRDDAQAEGARVTFDTSVAHIARIYNYWLGGKDNFAADREAAEQAMAVNPEIVKDVRANRAFLTRAVRYLAGECGIRQFLDIGTGIPTADNTHEVAQAVAPESRIVYVDNDPIVLVHARALLASHPAGATDYVEADLRDPQAILAQARQILDFNRPVALMLIAILHMIPDADDPHRIVAGLVDALPEGSYLALSHPASDVRAAAVAEMTRRLNARMGPGRGAPRDKDQVTRFFEGLELAEPGIVQPQSWRPAGPVPGAEIMLWCGVARKG